jgi:hypothetical protein
MIRFRSLTQPRPAVLALAILLTAAFGAACGSGAPKSASSSSSSSSPSSATGAPFEGEITSTMFMGSGQQVQYSIKGSRTRIETRLPQGGPQTGAGQASVLLMDYTSTSQTLLFPQTKTYMPMNLGATMEKMGKEAGNDATNDFPKMTSTGKTETVAGITCQHWLIGDKMDTCLAQGMGYFSGGSGGILDKLKNFALRDKFKAQLDANPEFAKFVEGGAFPLKMTLTENGQSKLVMEVTKIERKSLDDSLFTVPADYKKMELPKIPGMPDMNR